MKAEDIHLNDWGRILIGDVPASFLVELVIRAAVVYLLLMISMRSMGKRMSSHLSRNELATMVSLAAAVGVPMMAPDRGLLPAFVIALMLICLERLVAWRAFKSETFEKFAQGEIGTLVSDGVINVKALASITLSRERLLAQLRSSGVTQLGAVKRLYIEASGSFTLVTNPTPVPGLPTLPGSDNELAACFEYEPGMAACGFCAYTRQKLLTGGGACPNCGKVVWMPAVRAVHL